MHTRMNQSGAALILLIGITATLAILSSMMVFVIQNEQRATASSRSSKQSLYASEAALDAGVAAGEGRSHHVHHGRVAHAH